MEVFPRHVDGLGVRFGKPCMAGPRIDVATHQRSRRRRDDEDLQASYNLTVNTS
jgi:uncharacterized protein (DUF433 family)